MSYRGLRRLGMSLREHLKDVLIPVAVPFVLVLRCNVAVLSLLRSASPLTRVLVAGATTAILLAASCLILVLAESERVRIRSFLGLIHAPANS